jgi:hypothetical protein
VLLERTASERGLMEIDKLPMGTVVFSLTYLASWIHVADRRSFNGSQRANSADQQAIGHALD